MRFFRLDGAPLPHLFEVSRISLFGCAKPSFTDVIRLGPNLHALPANVVVWRLEALAQYRRVFNGQKAAFMMKRTVFKPEVMSKTPV